MTDYSIVKNGMLIFSLNGLSPVMLSGKGTFSHSSDLKYTCIDLVLLVKISRFDRTGVCNFGVDILLPVEQLDSHT